MSTGYIYVLANSSMPDLVKVGKTNKIPSERAQELSGVTGVPTPFIVVYEHHCEDCDEVESLIHSLLERKGYRVSENREFFKAPVHEVIALIMSLPYGKSKEKDALDIPSGDDASEYDDLLDTSLSYAEEPWRGMWEKADKVYWGLGDELQDYQEAFTLCRDAARLGCIYAYTMLGDMYLLGQGVAQDLQKALDIYKKGAKRGNYVCLLKMADIFHEQGLQENKEKCISMFFRDRASSKSDELEEEAILINALSMSISTYIETFKKLPREHIDQIRGDRDALISSTISFCKYTKESDPQAKNIIGKYEDAIEWLEHI